MAVIKVPGPVSGKKYSITISGDSPSVDEQKRIDAFVSQREQAFQTQYAKRFGAPIETGESTGIANYLGEIPKGIARGAVNFGESALLGAAAALPESWEDAARSGIRRGAYALSPQADIGLEGNIPGAISEGIGSMAIPYAAAYIPFAGPAISVGLSTLAGAGEASENARSAGATPEQRGTAALLGLGAGALDILPVHRLEKALGAPVAAGIKAALGRAVVQGGVEGAQETVQQIAQNLIARGVYDPDKDIWANTGESAGLGGGTGALVSLLTELIPGRRRGGATPPAEVPNPTKDKLLPAPDKSILYASPTGDISNFASTPVPTPEAPFELTPDMLKTAGLPAGHPLYKQVENGLVDGPAAIDGLKKAYKNIKDSKIRQGLGAIINSIVTPTNAGISTVTPAPTAEAAPAAAAVDDAQKKVEEAAATVSATTTQADPALKAAADKTLKDTQAEAAKVQEDADKAATGEPVEVPVEAPTLAPNEAQVMEILQRARKNQLAGSPQLVSKKSAKILQAAGLLKPEELLVPMMALGRVNELLHLGPDEVRARMTPVEQAGAETTAAKEITAAPVRPTPIKDAALAARAERKAAQEVQDVQVNDNQAVGTGAQDAGRSPENGGPVAAAAQPAPGAQVTNAGGLDAPASDTNGLGAAEAAQPGTLSKKVADIAERVRQTYGKELTSAELQELEGYFAPESATKSGNPSRERYGLPEPTAPAEVTGKTKIVDLTPRQINDFAQSLGSADLSVFLNKLLTTDTAPTVDTIEATIPGYTEIRELQIALAERATAETVAAHQAVRDAFWTKANELDDPLNAVLIDSQADETKQKALPEITTAEDARKIVELLNRSESKLAKGAAEARNAVSYFSRFARPIDAIMHMVELAGNKNAGLYRALLENGEDVNPAETAFSRGHGYKTATNALKWAAENLESWPKIQAMIDIRAGQPRVSVGRVMSSVDRIKRLAASLDELEAQKNKQFTAENIDEEQDNRSVAKAVATANAKVPVSLGSGEGVTIENPVTLTAERSAQLIAEIDARNAERKLLEATISEDDRRIIKKARKEDEADRALLEKQRERADKNRAKTLEQRMQEQRDQMARAEGILPRMSEIARMLGQRLMSVTENLLANNNLRTAMYSIAETSSEPRLAKLAMKMRTLIKDTQVRMVDTLSSPDGRTMAAAYDPATDTILFNRSAPDSMTNVTVLHEVAHAITHKALNNPSLPITQQLTKLFEEAQKAIGTDTVGMNNIHEFVAEAFTNKMFRDMLQASYPNGSKFPAWARFKNAVANFIRRVFGAQPKPLGSVMDDLDMHLDQLLDTASDVTGPRPDPGQGLLYRASNDPKELTGAMARMFREEQKFGMPNKSFRDNWANRAMALYTNSKGLLSKGVLGFSSLLQLSDTATVAGIAYAPDLYDAVSRLEASTLNSDKEVQAALVRMEEWVKKFPQQRSTLNKIVAFSTINQVDPEKNTSVYEQYWLKYDPTGEYKDGVQYIGYKTKAERDAEVENLRVKYGKDKAKSAGNANPAKAALHKEMEKSWEALGPEGRAIYNLMRQTYKKQFMAMRDAVGGKIDFALGPNSALAKSIKSNIYERFFDFQSLEPYFPLVRKGEYWMAYTVYDPVTEQEEEVKETFQTREERDRVRSLLAKEVPGVRIGADGKPEVRMYEDSGLKRNRIGAPETKFVRDVLSSLVANKVSDKAQNEISELFINALPETSFARAIKGREGVRGFESDALEAFRLKAFTLGRQAARYPYIQRVQQVRDSIAAQGIDATNTLHWLSYDPTGKFDGKEKFQSFKTAKEMDTALEALRKQYGVSNAKPTGMTTESKGPVHTALVKELVMRADTAMNPPQGAWENFAKTANQFAFTYTLGLNISSALVNLSAVPIVMVPYLSGKYGLANTTRTTRAAYKLFLNSGFNTNLTTATGDVVNVKATPSIDNYFELKDVGGEMEYVLRTDLNLSEAQKKEMQDMLPLVKLAAAQGLLSRSLTYDTLGQESFGQQKTMLDKLSMLQGLPFHIVERSNRQVSLMASYKMELERLRKNPTEAEKGMTDAQKQDQAAERAAYMTAEMHGTHMLSTAPRYAQSGIGRIAMMFKSYGLNIAYMQLKMLKQGCANLFPGEDAEARALRNTAFKQLAGLQLSTALIAGVSGVPLYGLYRMIANMFLGDDEEDADMLTRKAMGEWAFRGPLTEALGIDISSRTGLNDLLFRANPYANTQSNADFLAALIGGPAWSTGNQVLNGLTEMKKAALGQGGNFERGLENMLPPLPRNVLQEIRFASEGARTRRGDVVFNEFSPGQLVWKVTGFKPAELAQREEITRGAARMDKAVAQEKTMLLNRLNLAKSQGDHNEEIAARKDIQEYNAKVRAKYPKQQITPETIKSSGASFERVSARTHNGVTFNPATESYFTTLLSAYGAE